MKTRIVTVLIAIAVSISTSAQDFDITDVHVKKDPELRQLIFSIDVAGQAGDSTPTPIGSVDGAPVLGYVFPTTLKSYDVGFDTSAGIVALALTSHPDFDDTPLWDENLDMNYANDGVVWHSHWVLLENNAAVPGGLAVKATTGSSVLPPTNPGMPMYMDSPGFDVVWTGNNISCTVPLSRINNQEDFNYDGVTAYMQVNTSDPSKPMLGVYEVFDVASGNLSLPYSIGNYSCDTLFVDVSSTNGIGLVNPGTITLYPNPASTEVHLTMSAGLNMDTYEVHVVQLNGSLVYKALIGTSSLTIPTSEIGSSGTYVLSIVEKGTGEIKGSKKLVLY
ncbi:MAG: T9SS type A sorting domain-containing protein [Bacteroidia bacterium]|nr:T9SS type A sorting domain-containing protein [Bacteroidia bacterium]